jgi:hypothetical protein
MYLVVFYSQENHTAFSQFSHNFLNYHKYLTSYCLKKRAKIMAINAKNLVKSRVLEKQII